MVLEGDEALLAFLGPSEIEGPGSDRFGMENRPPEKKGDRAKFVETFIRTAILVVARAFEMEYQDRRHRDVL